MSTATSSHFARRIKRLVLRLALVAAVLFVLATSVVIVDEAETALVERFGRIVVVYDRPEDRGLHFKLPWPIDVVRSFDRRVQLLDAPARELFTRDRKNVTVEAYVCWKIAEAKDAGSAVAEQRPVVRFFRSLGDVAVAEQRLDSRLRSVLSSELGQIELSQLFSVEDSEQGPAEGAGSIEEISRRLGEELRQQAGEEQPLEERLGIEIVDVRIRRVNLPEANRPAVYERMRSERRKIADRYRSAGLAESRVIRSRADREAAEILARAMADAERIRGEGEAEAARILNEAHALDPELAGVLQTLDTYRVILGSKTTLVLSASSSLLRLLTDGIPPIQELPPEGAPPVGERVSRNPEASEEPER